MSAQPMPAAGARSRGRLPAGPRSRIPGRLLYEFATDPLGFLDRIRGYGDIVHFRLGPRSHYLLNKPEFIKDVMIARSASFASGYVMEKARVGMGDGLVTSDDPLHARQRRLVQRSFHRQRLATYAETMRREAEQCSATLQDGAVCDIHAAMSTLIRRIVMETLFNATPQTADRLGRAFAVLVDNSMLFYLLPYPRHLLRLPVPRLGKIRRAIEDIDDVLYTLIAARRQNGQGGGDLLSQFIEARDFEVDGTGMSDRQVRDECVSAFAAAYETTSNALTWSIYLSSRHAAVADRLRDEVDSVLRDRVPAIDDLGRLPYTKAVLSEAMRLYPPAWHLSRRAVNDYEVGGYTIPAGSVVMLNPWVTHRDPRFFADPGRFDPERFAPGAPPIPPFTYFPFGGGVRSCVGEGFAWLASVFVLAVLARDWTFHPTRDDVVPRPLMTLHPKDGMPMLLRRRRPR